MSWILSPTEMGKRMAAKKRERRTFTEEFKQAAAKRVADGEKATTVAKDVGVSLNSLRSWKYLKEPFSIAISDPGGAGPDGKVFIVPAESGIKHLRQENELLKAENEYLKRREEILRK